MFLVITSGHESGRMFYAQLGNPSVASDLFVGCGGLTPEERAEHDSGYGLGLAYAHGIMHPSAQ